MNELLDNLSTLLPFVAIPWALLIARVIWRPQHFSNSLLLLIALFPTLIMVSVFFGPYQSTVLIIIAAIICLTMLISPVVLMVNGIMMMRREGRSLANLLSLFVGILIGLGEVALIRFVFTFGPETPFTVITALEGLLGTAAFYLSSMLLAFMLYSLFILHMPFRKQFDYVVVHGCGLLGGSRISKLLGNRLDTAIRIYEACEEKPVLIPSGGKGSDESLSEAEAMAGYLREHGVPSYRIVLEDQSATTMENLENSRRIIEGMGQGRTALVSSNYHVYRCLRYARTVGLECVGVGAPVAAYYWPSAIIREFVAVFREPKMMICLLVGLLIFVSPVLLIISAHIG